MCKINKILISGGAGFIGSNLIEGLLSEGNYIVCLDNFSTGKKENIIPFLNNKNFELVDGDIRNYITCMNAIKGCSIVLHQAALGSVPRSINDPLSTNEVNITGFLNMLEASRMEGVERFIYAASSSTYGDSKNLPKKEDIIGNPLSPYAITKYVNELYANIYHKIYGLNTIGLRYFNVFGKRQDPNGAYSAVIPIFMKKLINGEQPIINGDGTYSRDFTYIENVKQLVNLCITSDNEDIFGNVFNCAYGESNTINELFYSIRKKMSRFLNNIDDIEPIYKDVREGDVPHSLADVNKAKEMLNYNPVYDLDKGLEESVEWYIKYIKKSKKI